ncbi:hypothetical protein FRACA_590016 [Frankia canadensis]|uniref:Uncharacterized protein n=1 Tax=Frankia canadensis TaxID=1836972 RepID=A0A2I2KZA0_9ACTN|nr:hypothetical protein FRACA_590016 [Frankia canadensis]SOU58284.1 hypothetical protein FRACA_590016 [Frankia canadensis]
MACGRHISVARTPSRTKEQARGGDSATVRYRGPARGARRPARSKTHRENGRDHNEFVMLRHGPVDTGRTPRRAGVAA